MSLSMRTLIKSTVINAMLLREWWQSGVTYNPLSPRVYSNPYPTYEALRSKAPVHWSALMDAWVVARYRDIDTILRDHKRFSNDPRKRRHSRLRQAATPSYPAPSMLFVDPPEHTRLRALVSKAFTPHAIEALRRRIWSIVQELLDAIEDETCFDVIETLAYPLPVIVMAELLGIPPKDRTQFKVWSDLRARMLEPTIKAHERQAAIRAGEELNAYFVEIIAQRRREPRQDLISKLVAVEEGGDALTQHELLTMLRLLLIAGNETTTNLIGNGLLALLRHPEQLQALRDEPALMTGAIEECLRYDTPVQVDGRTVMEDVDIAGCPMTGGQGIVVLIGSANHDAEVFHQPQHFDITRQEASHLSFGRGIHHCLGAPLARLESRLAFEALLERFTDFRLLTEAPRFKDNVVLRGLESLPISATRGRARKITPTSARDYVPR